MLECQRGQYFSRLTLLPRFVLCLQRKPGTNDRRRSPVFAHESSVVPASHHTFLLVLCDAFPFHCAHRLLQMLTIVFLTIPVYIDTFVVLFYQVRTRVGKVKSVRRSSRRCFIFFRSCANSLGTLRCLSPSLTGTWRKRDVWRTRGGPRFCSTVERNRSDTVNAVHTVALHGTKIGIVFMCTGVLAVSVGLACGSATICSKAT